jgi:hypothetical protein
MRQKPWCSNDRDCIKALGMFYACAPRREPHEGFLLLGAKAASVRKRIACATLAWQHGARYNTLWLLGGNRLIGEDEKALLMQPDGDGIAFATFHSDPAELDTEANMMDFMFRYADVPLPKDTAYYELVEAPPRDNRKTSNTEDTYAAFLGRHPPHGLYACVSHQPFVERQALNAMHCLKNTGIVTYGIGNEATESNILVYLDEVARLLYEETRALRQQEQAKEAVRQSAAAHA